MAYQQNVSKRKAMYTHESEFEKKLYRCIHTQMYVTLHFPLDNVTNREIRAVIIFVICTMVIQLFQKLSIYGIEALCSM